MRKSFPIARAASAALVPLFTAAILLVAGGREAEATQIGCGANCPPPPPPGPVTTSGIVYGPQTFFFGPGNDDLFNVEVDSTAISGQPTLYDYRIEVIAPGNVNPVTLAIPLVNQNAFTNDPGMADAGTPYAAIFGSAYPYVVELSSGNQLDGNTPPYAHDAVYDLQSYVVPVEGVYATTDETGTNATFDPPIPGGPIGVPEPRSAALLGAGLVAILCARRRRVIG